MRILAIDIGTGTQDILLYDTQREPENSLKLVMPSATTRLAGAIREATQAGRDLVLTGVTMGGGPSSWAIEEHLKAGLRVFATPDAACTLDDDLEAVAEKGVHLVSDDEAARLVEGRRLRLVDLDYAALTDAFSAFGVDLGTVDLVAVAVFDHGAAPPGMSDRLFRFEYLSRRLGTGLGLGAFAFAREAIPASMTRLQAAASCAPADRPVLVMDTAPAAVLGALEDPRVRLARRPILVNVGNMHTLAFHLQDGKIAALVEHHTNLLDAERLLLLLEQLAAGTVSNQHIFADHGHGALVLERVPAGADLLAITGPRRALLAGAALRQVPAPGTLQPYQAVPHGDMMMAGCWGLVRATPLVFPWTAEQIAAEI